MSFGSMTAAKADYELPSPPSDGVSDLTFSPTGSLITAGSWDNGVRVWELQRGYGNQGVTAVPKAQINHDAPVLCTDFSSDGTKVFSGGASKQLNMWSLGQPGTTGQQIGVHDAAVKSIRFIPELNLVASASWDKTVKFWDTRSSTPAAVVNLCERAYSMDTKGAMMVVATADRKICVYNLGQWTNGPAPQTMTDSPLRYQTRCVSIFPDQQGFAVGSIEGRVGIEYFSEQAAKAQVAGGYKPVSTYGSTKLSFAFKCHRVTGTQAAVDCSNSGHATGAEEKQPRHLKMFKNMFEEIGDPAPAAQQGEEEVLGRAESGFVGLDNQGATCYLNALLQAIYMTPELRHGLYAVDPKDLGGDKYEAEREQDRENEKARLAKERARLKKHEKEGKIQPNPEIVKQLLGMFSENGARRAALKTNNKSFDAALEWALAHSEDKDFEDPLPGYDDDDGAGASGAAAEGAGAEDGSGASGKKKKGRSAKMIPLELQRLFARLQLLDSRTVSTEDLTERGFKWKNDEGRMQHDAHELIRLLIDRLERDMRNSKVNARLVSALYEGDLANQVKCLACGHVSERLEKYRDLLLQVQGQEDLVTSLLSYTRPERLSGDNKYFCDNCQEKQDALRSQTLRALPPVLIFSLNRFEFDFETLERVKVKQAFKYPVTLDMEPFVEGRAWVGNDNSDESQVPELAGDPEVPGTCRHRQKWVPQAWEEAVQEGGKMQSAPPLASNDQRQAVKFDDDAKVEDGRGITSGGGGGCGEEGKGERNGGAAENGQDLVYDLLAVVVHRGSAYSGHYHALIRDCLQEGRWLPPSGLTPSLPSDMEEGKGGQEERKRDDGDATLGSGSGSSADAGFKHAADPKEKQPGQMELLMRVFKEEKPPKHPELGLPHMQLSALRVATKERLGGRRWDKVYGQTNRLISFIKDNTDTFLVQENEEEGGRAEVILLRSEGDDGDASVTEPPAANAESDPELEEALRLSREQAKESGVSSLSNQVEKDLAPANGTALPDGADGGKGSPVPAGVADALASEKHGRWFSFDDRKVTPISIRDLQRPFSGAETAYLLIYRSRSLDQEVAAPLSTADIAAAVKANVASAGRADGCNSSSSSRILPGGLHMTSVPPSYWMDKVDTENDSLKTAKDSKESDLHGLKLRVWLPRLLQPRMPHLVPLDPTSSGLQQLPGELRAPLVLHMDDRQTVKDLKREVAKRLGNRGKQMGVPDLGRMRLSELATHGPGLFLSRHIPNQPDEEDQAVQSRRQPRRRGGTAGGRRRTGDWEDESPVLGDLDWDLAEEPSLLVWDGGRVGGVEVLQPSPHTRPIRLVVSVLKASEDVDRCAWIDGVLEQAGTFGPRAEPRGPRAETSQCWKEVYATAGATAAEMVEIVSNLGPAEVSPSKMCISLLRAQQVPPDYLGTGRRRVVSQMEAVQIAGPSGVFEEWKSAKAAGAGGKAGGGGGVESAGLELSEGSELLVEEQGAVSKLIATEYSSLADMEAARRNRLVRVEVEVDELLVDTLRGQGGLPLAHDVAVAVHSDEPVTLKLECDAQATSIPHLKALCLLDLVPSLDKLPSAEIKAILPPPPPTPASSSAGPPARSDDPALVALVKTVRLENRKSGNTLDESSAGASLFAAKIADGTPLLLEWGAPPATGKALVKFFVRVGNSTATARDPSRTGTTYGPLEVMADLKEPVSALKARMAQKAAESGYIAGDDKERRIRVESLIGDSNTLIEELKDVEPEDKDAAAGANTGASGGKGRGKRDNAKAKGGRGGEAAADGSEEAVADGAAEAEADGDGDGAAGKGKKKKKKKKGGTGGVKGKGGTVGDKDGATEEASNGATAAALAAAGTAATVPADGGGAAGEEGGLPPFQDRLVEESGILGGQEIFLEDGRVPRPREIEVTVLAYAPHFLGLASAACTELKLKNKALSDAAAAANKPDGTVSTSDAKADTAAAAAAAAPAAAAAKSARMKRAARRMAKGKGEGAPEGCSISVPTGLSVRPVWPDEEAARKKTDVDKHRADPVRLLSLQRQLSLRTLGSFHIDERRSSTELRSILRDLLSEGLKKATKASIAEAARAAQEAAEAAAAAPEARAGTAAAAAGGDADVMADDEIENIRNMVMMKNKNPKSRKKRNSQGRGTAAAAAAAKPPQPPPPPLSAEGANGYRSSSAGPDADADAASTLPPTPGELESLSQQQAVVDARDGVKEVKTDFADSDDEIPLPEGVPGFEALEEAMLVRELTKDRLPGKIVRSSVGSGNTAGGLFVAQPISELHLSSSVALVLCLRPRLPQTPLVLEAHMSRREKLANEILENGQADKGGDDAKVEEDHRVSKEPSLREQAQLLEEAQLHLEAHQSNLEELVKKREFDMLGYEHGYQNYLTASKAAKSEEQKKSVARWQAELKRRKDRIDNTQHTEERPLKKEVDAMKAGVEELKKKLKKAEQDNAKAAGVESASIFTRVKGVFFSGAKLVGLGKADDTAEDKHINGNTISGAGKGKESSDAVDKEAEVAVDDSGWGIPTALGKQSSTKAKASSKSGKGGSTKKPGAAAAPPTPAPGASPPTAAGAGGGATAGAALLSAETPQADIQRLKDDEVERRRTDPLTDLHLWTFWRKNPLGDGGALPIDDPAWPGPLKEVIVEKVSQPTLDNLHEALGKAYGLPANRVWAIKHNWSKHEWVRFTREMGIKKASKSKKSKGKRLVTNLREAPYSLKDGDVVAVVDRMEDEFAQADLTRADDEAYRDQGKGQAKAKKDGKGKKKKKPASKRAVPEVGLTLGGWDDGEDSEESEESDDSADDMGDLLRKFVLPLGAGRGSRVGSHGTPLSQLNGISGIRNKGGVAASFGGFTAHPGGVAAPSHGTGKGPVSIGSSTSKPFSAAAPAEDAEGVVSSVQGYYDDPNALNYHMQAWGGAGDIHVGRYDLLDEDERKLEVRERMKLATKLSTGMLLGKAFPKDGPSPVGSTIADFGAGFGSTARAAAREYGCNVECVEISQGFNAANAEFSAAEGLSSQILIPDQRSFFDTKLPAGSMDVVISQDSFCHCSTEHHRAVAEAARVLRPGGLFVFTDLMQTDAADTTKLEEVYRQIGITRLGSPKSFEEMANAGGLELVEFEDYAPNLVTHYENLVEVSLASRSVITGVNEEWFNKMVARYSSWVSASEYDVLTWGLLVFKKKSD
eukprot:g1270.t1